MGKDQQDVQRAIKEFKTKVVWITLATTCLVWGGLGTIWATGALPGKASVSAGAITLVGAMVTIVAATGFFASETSARAIIAIVETTVKGLTVTGGFALSIGIASFFSSKPHVSIGAFVIGVLGLAGAIGACCTEDKLDNYRQQLADPARLELIEADFKRHQKLTP